MIIKAVRYIVLGSMILVINDYLLVICNLRFVLLHKYYSVCNAIYYNGSFFIQKTVCGFYFYDVTVYLGISDESKTGSGSTGITYLYLLFGTTVYF